KKGNTKLIKIDDFLIDYGENRLKFKVNNKGGFNIIDFFNFWNYNYTNSYFVRENIIVVD
ncbi:MAG: hypothetical protein SVN78_09985, partial [Deferribacterota bacterium]|nr:hypothetical protein [Deferribacterota bacterium]